MDAQLPGAYVLVGPGRDAGGGCGDALPGVVDRGAVDNGADDAVVGAVTGDACVAVANAIDSAPERGDAAGAVLTDGCVFPGGCAACGGV